jgi:hypothetical protein
MRDTWKSINEVLGTKQVMVIDEMIMRYLGKNENFANIANNFAKESIKQVKSITHRCNKSTCNSIPETVTCVLNIQEISEEGAKDLIRSKMKINKGPGADGVK